MIDIFKERRSVRKFKDKEIEDYKKLALFEAARWAPSAYNSQPWYYVFIDDREKIKSLKDALSSGNEWAIFSPMIIVACVDSSVDKDYNNFSYSAFDCGLSVENLLLKARELNLSAHPMGGFNKDKLKKILEIPESIDVCVVIAVGYPDEKRKGERKSLNEFVFKNKFGNPAFFEKGIELGFTFEIPLRFSDFDALGHLNNARYLTVLEEARVKFFKKLDLVFDAKDFSIIIGEISIKYLKPVFFNEPIEVEIVAKEFFEKGFNFYYTLSNAVTREKKAVAKSVQIFFDYKKGKVTTLPENYKQALLRLVGEKS